MKNTNIIITKEKQLDKVIRYCKKTKYASIDFETNGRPFHHPLFLPTILGISFQPGISYILPLAHKDSPFKAKGKWLKYLKKFGKEVLEDKDIIKIAWNFKFELKVLQVYDIKPNGRLYDGMLAKYLLKEERPNDLKSVVAQFIPYYANYDLKGSPSSKAPVEKIVDFWSNVEIGELSKYCGLDADLTLRLMMFFEYKLIEHNFYKLFRNMMMMATRVLNDSEYHGILIDKPYLEGLVDSYKIKIDDIERELRSNQILQRFEKKLIDQRIKKLIMDKETEIETIEGDIMELKSEYKKTKDTSILKKIDGKSKLISTREATIDKLISRDLTTKKELDCLEPVNFSSPKQMLELFFTNKMGFNFKIVKYTVKDKKETDNPSTDEEVLQELLPKDKTGFIENLLTYRGLTKLYSTYVLGMNDKVSLDNKIHGSFLLHGTVTGRLSSREPNLQNIPRDTTSSDIKKMFIPPPGYVLLQLDYSQAELRVMAAQANEVEMLRWFKEGRDIHLSVACDKNKWDYDEALVILEKEDKSDPMFTKVKTQRKYAKTINFGIIYGQTAKKLALGMESSVKEAEVYLKEYTKRFPNIWKHISRQHKYVSKHGYVYNIFGRKRRLPNIWADDWGKSAEAQRQSVNAPIQGAASDYTLFSSILIWERIQKGLLPKDMVQAYTVHDSLGYFVKPEDIHTVVPILEAICSNPETKEWFGFQIDSVNMKVDFEVSHLNWGELKTYHKETNYVEIVKEYRITLILLIRK